MKKGLKKVLKGILIIISVAGTLFLVFPFIIGFDPAYGTPVFEFPIEQPLNITKMSAFNTPDWGEPGVFHNGIDLVIEGHNYTNLLSPCNGLCIGIDAYKNSYSEHGWIISVHIMVNYFWNVNLVIEPMFLAESDYQTQIDLIQVKAFQKVHVGDFICPLLDGGGYAHLHYMVTNNGKAVCAYQYSSSTARTIFEDVALATASDICYP